MPQSFAEFDSQYLSSRQKHISFLPTSKSGQRGPRHKHAVSQPSPLHQETFAQHHRKESSHAASAATSAATSRSSTATSSHSNHDTMGGNSVREASMRAREITPTADIALWAHQMHLKQGQSHWWCQGCFPKEVTDPMPIPKAVTGRRVRINEPTHCYDI